MHFSTAFAAALLLTITTALPTVDKRTPGNVEFCTGENYTRECISQQWDFNTCYTLPQPYYKNVGSMGVAVGAYCRITYTEDSCTPHGDAFVYPPGEATLHHFTNAEGEVVDAGANFTSFLCQECSACT